jgi:hypothetical protein
MLRLTLAMEKIRQRVTPVLVVPEHVDFILIWSPHVPSIVVKGVGFGAAECYSNLMSCHSSYLNQSCPEGLDPSEAALNAEQSYVINA